MSYEVNWYEKVVDWAWIALVGAAGLVGGAVIKLWRHEERIKALEAHHIERTKKLSEIERKIDNHHAMQLSRIDANGKELRDDLRMIVSKMIDKVPHG